MRRLRLLIPVALLTLAAAGCKDTLSVEPEGEVREERAIIDARSARAALAGAYNELQDGNYYGGDFLFYADLASGDVDHVGTFSDFASLDELALRTDNETLEAIWETLYAAIGRVNKLIARVPQVPGLEQEERDDMLGQAHFLRALHYHNLVQLWGGVPLRLTPPKSVPDLTSDIPRSTAEQVYAQIHADLDLAEQMITNTSTRSATVRAVHALRSRVYLHQGNWQGVIDEANTVNVPVSANGDTIRPTTFRELFSDQGQDTDEDILRLQFTPQEFNNLGFYYYTRSLGGRREIAPSFDLIDLYGSSADPGYDPDTLQTTDDDGNLLFDPADERAQWGISFDARDRRYGRKIPTVIGDEDIHVIRGAEVLLNKAEAQARLNDLTGALETMNIVRRRARVSPLVFGVSTINGSVIDTQDEVLEAIWRERRLELAFEGFAWTDLVRTGRAVPLLEIEEFMTLWPIPQNEIDVSSRVEQNPGY